MFGRFWVANRGFVPFTASLNKDCEFGGSGKCWRWGGGGHFTARLVSMGRRERICKSIHRGKTNLDHKWHYHNPFMLSLIASETFLRELGSLQESVLRRRASMGREIRNHSPSGWVYEAFNNSKYRSIIIKWPRAGQTHLCGGMYHNDLHNKSWDDAMCDLFETEACLSTLALGRWWMILRLKVVEKNLIHLHKH